MSSINFKNRKSEKPNRRRVVKYNGAGEIIETFEADIIRDETLEGTIYEQGTKINEETFTEINTVIQSAKAAADSVQQYANISVQAKNDAEAAKDSASAAQTSASNSENAVNVAVNNITQSVNENTAVVNNFIEEVRTDITEFTTGVTAKINSLETAIVDGQGTKLYNTNGTYSIATAKITDTILSPETVTLATKEYVDAQCAIISIIDALYPVGHIIMTTNASNPNTYLGGTWKAWGDGRVPIGMGSNGESNYTIVEATGGSENSVASHTHTISQTSSGAGTISSSGNGTSGSAGAASGKFYPRSGNNKIFGDYGTQSATSGVFSAEFDIGKISADSNSSNYSRINCLSLDIPNHTHTTPSHTHTTPNHTHTISNLSFGTTGGNRQPYITCYMWLRIA